MTRYFTANSFLMSEFITSVSLTGLDSAFHLPATITNKILLFSDKRILFHCITLKRAVVTGAGRCDGETKPPSHRVTPRGISTTTSGYLLTYDDVIRKKTVTFF